MTQQDQWMNEMMNITRISLDTSLRSLEIFQNQAEKAIEFMMKNAGLVQDESQKALQTWMDTARNARRMYADALNQGLETFEKQVKTAGEKK